MTRLLLCGVLLLANFSLAQQMGPPSSTRPPYQTPPTFPEGSDNPAKQLPPETKAPTKNTEFCTG
jgi:hypothetical protein